MSASASIVVPTRDRPAALRRCVGTLADQIGAPELIVVDDGSRDASAVRAAAGGSARLIRLEGRGPAAARNAGLAAARGDVVCLIDDDCEAVPAWASLLAEAAAELGTAMGPTLPAARSNAYARASQCVTGGLVRAALDEPSGRAGFAPSCNLAIRRDLIPGLRFDERFPLAAGEDRAWSDRARAAGHPPAMVARAVVVHHGRMSAAAFARQQLAYGRGAAAYRALSDQGLRPPARGLRRRLVAQGLAEGPGVGALVAAAQALTAAGFAAERLARRS